MRWLILILSAAELLPLLYLLGENLWRDFPRIEPALLVVALVTIAPSAAAFALACANRNLSLALALAGGVAGLLLLLWGMGSAGGGMAG